MPGIRKESQTVEAFSVPKDMLREAQLEAKRRRMTKSGFYRYCLAKELGRGEQEALRIAEHAAVGHFNVINTTGDHSPVHQTTNFSSASTPPASKPVVRPKGKRGLKKKR